MKQPVAAMDIDLFSLEAFLTVCEEGSFAAAARRLFLSEPAVSVRIRNLEERLGFGLFSRSPKGVRVTHAGLVLRAGLARVMDDLSACIEESQAAAQQARGQLTLWAPPVTLAKLLPSILDRFGTLHPSIHLRTQSERPAEVLSGLILGQLDCAAITDIQQPRLDGFQVTAVLSDLVGLVLASDHPLAQQVDLSVHDLEPFRLLGYERKYGYWPLVRRALTRNGYRPSSTLAAESLDTLRALTRRGHGIVFLPKVIVLDDIQQGDLIFRPVDLGLGQRLELVTWFCFAKAHELAAELGDLRDIIADAATEIQSQLSPTEATVGAVHIGPAHKEPRRLAVGTS